MSLQPGQSLGHYRLVEKIGEGGMGVVWRADDTKLGRQVALKVLPADVADDPERRARFQREARTLAALLHPNIASIFGFEEVDGVTFLIMELVEGEDLSVYLGGGPLSMKESLDLASQLASGLEEAHKKGIVHRDLKPANIMRTADGRVKILDFGLARVFDDSSASEQDLTRSPTVTANMTRKGVVFGTAPYMSPEQARGKMVDKRTDIWAFGCVLFEAMTGRRLFSGETVTDVLVGILEREPDWNCLPPETPPLVRSLLRRCLSKDANSRLQDAGDARIEIEEALGDSEVWGTSMAEAAAGRGENRGTRAGLMWALAGLTAGALATALVTVDWQQPARTVSPSPGRFVIPLRQDAPNVPYPDTSAVALSRDGNSLVYVAVVAVDLSPRVGAGDISGRQTQLFLHRMDSGESTPIEETEYAAAPFFSPDGKWIGYIDYKDGRLKKIRIGGGMPAVLSDASMDFRGAAWGDDGKVYYASANDGIRAVSENGGHPETLTVPDREKAEKTHRYPDLLPGGKGVLFTLGTSSIASYDDAMIALLSLETGKIRVLLEGGTNPHYSPSGHIVFARGGGLKAVPFDLDSLRVTAPPFDLLEGVVTSEGYGSAHYAFSDNGTLVFTPGGPENYHYEIFLLDLDGNVDLLPLPSKPYGDAQFSPDGRKLAISILGANAGVWLHELERQTMTPFASGWDNYSPIWTRDGSGVTFGSNRNGSNGIWHMRADGSGSPELLVDTGASAFPGTWAPDDQSLTYSVLSDGTGADAWLWSRDEEPRNRPLLDTPFQETYPVLSPDGRWLAYVSNASGRPEVYVEPFPATGQRWQISSRGGDGPLWAPDGRELLYWRGNQLMAARVTTQPSFVPTKERVLIETEFMDLLNWDVAPDGERFVVVGRTESQIKDTHVSYTGATRYIAAAGIPELRVVTNWFEDIRRRSGAAD